MSYNARHQVHGMLEGVRDPYYARDIEETSMDGRVSSRFSAIETDAARNRRKLTVVPDECHKCNQKYENKDYRFCPWCGQMKSCLSCGGLGRVKRKVQNKHDDGHTEEFDVESECNRCIGSGREPSR